MLEFLKRLFYKEPECDHIWATMLYSYRHYDQEIWEECVKCKKQESFNGDL